MAARLKNLQQRLEDIGILSNANLLPVNAGFRADEGLRLGTQEVAWLGMSEDAIEELGHLIGEYCHSGFANRNSARVRVREIRKGLQGIVSTSQNVEDENNHLRK